MLSKILSPEGIVSEVYSCVDQKLYIAKYEIGWHKNIYLPKFMGKTNLNWSLILSDIGTSINDMKIPFQRIILDKLYQDIKCGLQYLHNFNYVHGDVKPGNIIYLDDTFKLIDFGSTVKRYSEWKLNGTVYYCSISFLNGELPDFYQDYESLLYVLEFLRTGTLPWINETNLMKISTEKIMYLERLISNTTDLDEFNLNEIYLKSKSNEKNFYRWIFMW